MLTHLPLKLKQYCKHEDACKKVKFCTNECHSTGSWGPEILGGRTEEGDGGDKQDTVGKTSASTLVC